MMGHHAKVDHDSIDEMMKWITHMVDRHMCAFSASASAHLAAGGKFKGVDA